MAALLTDEIRSLVLEDMGYQVDVIEFTDLENSPKNLMLRARRTGKRSEKGRALAREVAARCGAEDLIIGADTIVWVDGHAFGKPHSETEAAAMLRRLSGDAHEVYTGVTVICQGRETSEYERSRVIFRPLEEEEIARYIQSGEPMDKAGAYGAQGRGALFVERIEGDFFNVMGLPLCRLGKMLKEQGVNIL
jgi:septum formation protein